MDVFGERLPTGTILVVSCSFLLLGGNCEESFPVLCSGPDDCISACAGFCQNGVEAVFCTDGTCDCNCREPGTGGTGGMAGTGGIGGTDGAGGTGGMTGTGGFMIEGRVVDDEIVGLDGVNVRAILGAAGITSVFTDNGGLFALQVNEVGDYRLCAVGAISDSLPRRFVSTNCEEGDDEVTVSDPSNDPAFSEVSITSGYYMEVTNAPFTFEDEPQGDDIMLRLNYLVWNRASVPNTTTHIVVGIEGVAQFAHPVGIAGPYSPSMQTTGSADVTLSASMGTIYARLLPLDAQAAIDAYNDGFSTARETNYVAIGTVTTQ